MSIQFKPTTYTMYGIVAEEAANHRNKPDTLVVDVICTGVTVREGMAVWNRHKLRRAYLNGGLRFLYEGWESTDEGRGYALHVRDDWSALFNRSAVEAAQQQQGIMTDTQMRDLRDIFAEHAEYA